MPDGSAVSDLVLSGGPETLEGKLLGADEATRIYEDIVRRLIDPALLRSLDGELYEVRAFPVPAGEERILPKFDSEWRQPDGYIYVDASAVLSLTYRLYSCEVVA